jgi:hypothetical protein
VVFGLSLGAVRTQANIQDEAWLKAMIPHLRGFQHQVGTDKHRITAFFVVIQ